MMSFSVFKQGYIVTFKIVTKNRFTNLEKANSLSNHRPICLSMKQTILVYLSNT